MNLKDFEISKESVLQALKDVGLEFTEGEPGTGATLETPDGAITVLPNTFPFFDTFASTDEYINVVNYVFNIVNKQYSNNIPDTYNTNVDRLYQNTYNDRCAFAA